MLSEALEKTLREAFEATRTRRQAFISVEDLLLHLLSDQDALVVLDACQANIEELRKLLTEFIAETSKIVEGSVEVDTQPTLEFQRVIQRAIMHVGFARSDSSKPLLVTGANVLNALFGETGSKAVQLLNSQGITRLDVVNFLAHGIKRKETSVSAEDAFKEFAYYQEISNDFLLNDGTKSFKRVTNKQLRLFISYSHSDADCLQRLLVHLKPLERAGLIDCWSDLKIRAGDKWKHELTENLEHAAVGILLISADYLASDFIINDELPPLLIKAEAKGIRIIPVILEPCGFHRYPVLQSFQALNDPRAPLLGLNRIQREVIYDRIAEEVHREINSRRD